MWWLGVVVIFHLPIQLIKKTQVGIKYILLHKWHEAGWGFTTTTVAWLYKYFGWMWYRNILDDAVCDVIYVFAFIFIFFRNHIISYRQPPTLKSPPPPNPGSPWTFLWDPLIFVCHCQDVCHQASADGFVAVSESEPLTFLQDHWLSEREGQGGVLPRHHHFLEWDKIGWHL